MLGRAGEGKGEKDEEGMRRDRGEIREVKGKKERERRRKYREKRQKGKAEEEETRVIPGIPCGSFISVRLTIKVLKMGHHQLDNELSVSRV